jgi:hypothetical protein
MTCTRSTHCLIPYTKDESCSSYLYEEDRRRQSKQRALRIRCNGPLEHCNRLLRNSGQHSGNRVLQVKQTDCWAMH